MTDWQSAYLGVVYLQAQVYLSFNSFCFILRGVDSYENWPDVAQYTEDRYHRIDVHTGLAKNDTELQRQFEMISYEYIVFVCNVSLYN